MAAELTEWQLRELTHTCCFVLLAGCLQCRAHRGWKAVLELRRSREDHGECSKSATLQLKCSHSHSAPPQHIHQVHRDIVVSLPPPFQSEPFINLGYTSRCAIQGLALPYPTEAPPLPSAAGGSSFIAFDINAMDDTSGPSPARSLHVLTLQGHPEFDEEIVKLIIDARTEMGTIDGDLREQGLERAARAHDGRRLGAAVLTMLGVEPRRTESGTQGDGGVGV